MSVNYELLEKQIKNLREVEHSFLGVLSLAESILEDKEDVNLNAICEANSVADGAFENNVPVDPYGNPIQNPQSLSCTDRITYEEFREYLKEFNPAHLIPPEWLSLTKEESEKAMAHLLVLLESFSHAGAKLVSAINAPESPSWVMGSPLITPTDIQSESALHSLIHYFRGRPQFAETAKAIEIAADPLISAVRKKVDNE